MKSRIDIRNMVITVSFSDKTIDLNYLANKLEGAEYAPESFLGLVYRIKKPKTSFLIFSSGVMNCTGARNMKEAKKAISQMLETLKKFGIKVKKPKIEVQNIVATYHFGKSINLGKVLKLEGTEYEPEQFPGLVYRAKGKVVFLIFSIGKVVCVGARTSKQIEESISLIIKNLKK